MSSDNPEPSLTSLEARIQKALGAVQAARTRTPSPFDGLGGTVAYDPEVPPRNADSRASQSSTSSSVDAAIKAALAAVKAPTPTEAPPSDRDTPDFAGGNTGGGSGGSGASAGDSPVGSAGSPARSAGRQQDDDPQLLEWGAGRGADASGASAPHSPPRGAASPDDGGDVRGAVGAGRGGAFEDASAPGPVSAPPPSVPEPAGRRGSNRARREVPSPRSPPHVRHGGCRADRHGAVSPAADSPASGPVSPPHARAGRSRTSHKAATRSSAARTRCRPTSARASSRGGSVDRDPSPRSAGRTTTPRGPVSRRSGGGGGGSTGTGTGTGTALDWNSDTHTDNDEPLLRTRHGLTRTNPGRARSRSRSRSRATSADMSASVDASIDGFSGVEGMDRPLSRSRKMTAEEARETSKRLYDNATKLRAKREQIAATVPDGCTFAPEVTAKARKRGVATGQERFEHLYRNAEATKRKHEHERRKAEASHTFRPRMHRSKSAMRASAATPTRSSVEAGERLYNDAKKSLERRRALARKVAAEEKARTRRVVPRSRTPAPRQRKPLYSPALLKKKKEVYERERLAKEMAGCTFKPKTTRSSSVPPRRGRAPRDDEESSLPVHERLMRYAKAVNVRQESKRQELKDKELDGATFRPKISAGSQRRVARSQSAARSRAGSRAGYGSGDAASVGTHGDGTVFDRLYGEAAQAASRLKAKRRAIQEEQGETFAPYITERSRRIAEAQREEPRLLEDSALPVDESNLFGPEDGSGKSTVFNRLYKEHQRVEAQLEEKRRAAEEAEVADCTFQPHTNTMRRRKGGPEVWQRLYSESQTNNEVHALWAELRKREEVEGCTFRPEINHNVAPPPLRSQEEDVWEWLAKPKEPKEPTKDPEATFKPKINVKSKMVAAHSADAAGTDAVYDRLYANALRSEKLRKEVLSRIKVQEELAGCTFVPQINKGYTPGGGGESVHQRLFRHAQHLQEQQRIMDEEAELMATPARSQSRSRSRIRHSRRSSFNSNASFTDAASPPPPPPGTRAPRRAPRSASGGSRRGGRGHDDVDAILADAVYSNELDDHVAPEERWEVDSGHRGGVPPPSPGRHEYDT